MRISSFQHCLKVTSAKRLSCDYNFLTNSVNALASYIKYIVREFVMEIIPHCKNPIFVMNNYGNTNGPVFLNLATFFPSSVHLLPN